jgi:hypothetical protein
MNATSAVRCTTSVPLKTAADDASERRQANRAIAVSALGLALTGLIELTIALVSGSVARFGDAVHNLSDVSISALAFFGFRASRKIPGTTDIAHRLLDGIDPDIITTAETTATTVPGVNHAQARARWTGRTLRIEVEAFLNPDITIAEADQIGDHVGAALTPQIPDMRSFTWTARGLTTDTSTTPQPGAELAASAGPALHLDPGPTAAGALTTRPKPEKTTTTPPLRGFPTQRGG